ncbi:aspartate/glutamate racemase family protein [Liquorilactobacillus mali]|uniref:Hydantoin racemase n=1 Tax=Liquorilactobacillus mali TaxID=1618 RepID=A0A0R2FXW7_9LACO|nr:aspartate/glutamate racemase family protein [Liquorilactobacillus mali]KRN29805.1 hypothetical protein IV36_GL000351 [Liquorilactobacillus mali]MDN7145540.1 aspartate/glutamate racemase family protein [Liquorilactobacillus mali]
MIGLIRVVTLERPEEVNRHAQVIEKKYGLSIKSACIPNQYNGIHNDETEVLAVPKILELGKQFKEQGCTDLIVSCAADPAIEQLREETGLFVIGAGSSAALIARSTGKKTGVIGITSIVPTVIEENLDELFAGYIKPKNINNTNDLLTSVGQENCITAVKQLIEQGAQQILFACTGMGTINLKSLLQEVIDVPVIDAVDAEGSMVNFYLNGNGSQFRRNRL